MHLIIPPSTTGEFVNSQLTGHLIFWCLFTLNREKIVVSKFNDSCSAVLFNCC